MYSLLRFFILFCSHYCPHYERDTCLILFKCCNEWYPCHKCHNEALTSLVEQNEMEPENSGPSPENEIVSVEMDDAEVESFDESIEIGSGAEEGMTVIHAHLQVRYNDHLLNNNNKNNPFLLPPLDENTPVFILPLHLVSDLVIVTVISHISAIIMIRSITPW